EAARSDRASQRLLQGLDVVDRLRRVDARDQLPRRWGDSQRISGHADCDRQRQPAWTEILRKRPVDLRTGFGIELRVLQVGDNTYDCDWPAHLHATADRVVRAEEAPSHRLVDEGGVRRIVACDPATFYKPHTDGAEVSRRNQALLELIDGSRRRCVRLQQV